MPPRRTTSKPATSKVECHQFYLIKYLIDGVLSIKGINELEHEEVTERSEFWVGDRVLALWDDGEKYLSEILALGSKATVQEKFKELNPKKKHVKKPISDSQARKKKQASELLTEVDVLTDNDSTAELHHVTNPEPDCNLSDDPESPVKVKNKVTKKRSRLTDSESIDADCTEELHETHVHHQKKSKFIISDEEPDDTVQLHKRKSKSKSKISRSAHLMKISDSNGKLHERVNTKDQSPVNDELRKWRKKYYDLKKSIDMKKPDVDHEEESTSLEKPKPGIVTPVIAKRFSMHEIVEGTGVYWTSVHEQMVLRKSDTSSKLVSACIDTFFDQPTLAKSNAKGGGSGRYSALDPSIIRAIKAFVLSRFSDAKPSSLNVVINNKCTAARRKCT